jgi:curved DNA-binding protein CbpA
MRQPPDPYRELGVPRGATDEQIKAAHRRLAKRFHPDASSGERERFMAIQEAYLLLTDPLRRRDWDARYAPGPVRAPSGASRGAPMARSRRGSPPRPDVTSTTARTSRGTTHGTPASGRHTAMPPREPGTQAYTWSAAGVPWWEDFQPKASGGTPPSGPPPPTDGPGSSAAGARPSGPGPTATPDGRPHDVDPYARSSGTAWSSAARRYFRQGDADLPRGGQFRYRGTQVVTGAEARRVADEELRRSQGAAPPPPRHAHPGAPPPAPSERPGFMARIRRLLGGG